MSLGPSGAIQFQVNKNAGTPGIFWQKEKSTSSEDETGPTDKPKNAPRKFGYKSKALRHPLRQPDEEEELRQMEIAKEEEKRKFNKNNKDFIRKNRERFHVKDQNQGPPAGTTEIKPGTVTLTQEQLAALLASLGKTTDKGGKDDPLRISIDPTTNKIEVERYDSDDSGEDVDIEKYNAKNKSQNARTRDDDDDDGGDDDVGIAAFLNGVGDNTKITRPRNSRENKRKTRDGRKDEEEKASRDDPRPQKSNGVPTPATLKPDPPTAPTRLSWDVAKKEAGVAHVPDIVPWKHLTVGEKKRLQWARERAEVAEEYNPWGRPGGGAPARRLDEDLSPTRNQHSVIGNDQWIHRPPKVVPELEKKKKQEELAMEIVKLQQEIREAEQKKKAEEEELEKAIEGSRRKKENERQSEEGKEQGRGKREKKRKEQREAGERRKQEDRSEPVEEQNMEGDDMAGLSKKEIERRQWLAELDKQREEQRMRKQQEKERDRTGIHDQWADRFVYHKTTEQTSPRRPQVSRNARMEEPVLGKAPVLTEAKDAPPAAMRSSMMVGAGTLNEHRYDNRKAEEKRKWLEELDRQREEQRQAKAAQKERERQEDGTWADRYPTDHQKLLRTNELLENPALSPRAQPVPEVTTTQRTSSAPHSTVQPLQTEEVPTTFLRGQGAFIDPVTRKEQEEKRRVHMEYQAQIKAQIEEKERKKKEERERKKREDMEEERKLQQERERFNQQQEMEQRKLREREELRQKQIAVLKSAMDEAQERAAEEKNVRRIHNLQQKGHDITQLKATYEEPIPMSRMSMRPKSRLMPGKGNAEPTATTPHIREYEMTSIPGLGLDSQRDHQSHHPVNMPSPERPKETYQPRYEAQPVQQSYSKEPYVEDRVLTPSRFRNPSKPRDLPDSPRREFGTQTLELKDLQAILQSLPDEVQIEYKIKVEEALKEKEKAKQAPSRKVHVKSAEANSKSAGKAVKQVQPKEKPVKLNERPQWNQRRRKTAVKNSEKDPFYQQRKEEAEQRRVKRERQLLYLQELNKEKIPTLSRSPVRSRDVSPEGPKPVGDRGRKPAPSRREQSGKTGKLNLDRDTSPNILSLIDEPDRGHKSRSPQTTGRSSPPIPAVRHRNALHQDTDKDPYQYTNNYLRNSQTDSKYSDTALLPNDDFLPFMRTTEILDPSKADEPVAISRENSRMERARKAYYDTHNPANKGRKLDMYQDREREAAIKASQNPLMNPGLVTDHPTARQDMILQQLSSLKQTLMQRQKELEDYMSPADFQEETARG